VSTDSLTDLSFNVANAFVGHVIDLHPIPVEDEDLRSLIFTGFLAAPYMTTNGIYKERKFCGNDGVPASEDTDDVALLVSAFAHHVVVDSHGEYLLTDLQGVVSPGPNYTVRLFDPQGHS
jgi:hypothetical protein